MSWATAVHESSHCTTAFRLGAMIGAGPASIVPGRSFHGITFPGRAAKYRRSDEAGIAAPLVLLPPRIRRQCETRVMICYGGYIGEQLHGHQAPERDESPFPEPATETVAVQTVSLPAREREALDEAMARDVTQSDMAKAWETLLALHFDDDDMALRHGRLLAAQTELILSGKTPRRMVLALATELMKHKTLSAREWQAVLRAAA